MTIGERIKNRREELGMTQDELARKCGYKSRSSINKIELSRDLPLRKVSLMADVLQTTPTYLMGWEEKTTAIKKISDITLSPEEEEIIYAYRSSDEVDKNSVRKILNVSIGKKESVVS